MSRQTEEQKERVIPAVVEHDRTPAATLFRFTCPACGARSGSFSLRASAEEAARTHVKSRCSGPSAEPAAENVPLLAGEQ